MLATKTKDLQGQYNRDHSLVAKERHWENKILLDRGYLIFGKLHIWIFGGKYGSQAERYIPNPWLICFSSIAITNLFSNSNRHRKLEG